MQAVYRSIIFLSRHIYTLVFFFFQVVLCSARMAGKSTKKPALAHAMASGKARIAQVRNIILYDFSVNLLAFYHEYRSLIGYATCYLFCFSINLP